MDYRKAMQLGLMPLSRTKPSADADAEAPESETASAESGDTKSSEDSSELSRDASKPRAAG